MYVCIMVVILFDNVVVTLSECVQQDMLMVCHVRLPLQCVLLCNLGT